jgi:hypothetical protein
MLRPRSQRCDRSQERNQSRDVRFFFNFQRIAFLMLFVSGNTSYNSKFELHVVDVP